MVCEKTTYADVVPCLEEIGREFLGITMASAPNQFDGIRYLIDWLHSGTSRRNAWHGVSGPSLVCPLRPRGAC